jgi:hypothetical protein
LQFELTDGRRVAGSLTNHTVSIRFHGKTWEIPAQHVVGIAGRAKEIASPKTPGQKHPSNTELAAKELPLRELPLPPSAGDGDPFGLPPALQPAGLPGVPVPTIPPEQGGSDPFGTEQGVPQFIPAMPGMPETVPQQILPEMPAPVAPPAGAAPAPTAPVETLPAPAVPIETPQPLPPTTAPMPPTTAPAPAPVAPPVANPNGP